MIDLIFQPRKDDAPGDGYFARLEAAQASYQPPTAPARGDKIDLDSEQVEMIWKRCRALYANELERQADNRAEMERDEAFYDGDQWSADEIALLEERGQAATVYNLIQTAVNWMLGTQRRSAMDYKILPRRPDGADSAQRKTELFGHVRDINHSQKARSTAFADAVKAGLGWLETGQSDEEDGALVFDRSESWRSMLWDSLATREDLQDCRFISRTKWVDEDLAVALWPNRQELIARSVQTGESGWASGGRDSEMADTAMDSREAFKDSAPLAGDDAVGVLRPRLRVVEFWFKRIENLPVMRGGQFNGEVYDPWSQGHWDEIRSETATVVTRPRETVWLMVMSEKGVLDLRRSPYRHNRYPFTPIWGYRRASDGMPYGVVRSMRPINQAINKYASKGLHAVGSTRVYVEAGSVDDLEETRNEIARPDGIIVYKTGHRPPQRMEDTTTPALMDGFFSRDAAILQSISGITDESMGRTTNATSGKAITARQDQGALATSSFFDNLRYAEMLHGEKLLVNIEQFYDRRMQFRITDDRNRPVWREINDTPATSITAFKADFIISQDEWRATVRQAQAQQLMDLMAQLAPVAPDLVVMALPIMLTMLDVPKSQDLAKLARQITKQPDPDEDPDNPSPETLANREAEAAAQQLQARMAEAQAAKLEAEAAKAQAESRLKRDQSLRERVQNQISALEAAGMLAANPALAAAADIILDMAEAPEPADLGDQAAGMPPPAPSPEAGAEPPAAGLAPDLQPMPEGAPL